MSYEISDDYAIPQENGRPGPKRKYPFNEMKVGQSLFIEGNGSAAAVSARSYASRNGQKFTVRKEDGGVRIWRTA